MKLWEVWKVIKFYHLILASVIFFNCSTFADETNSSSLFQDQLDQIQAVSAQMKSDYSELVDESTETDISEITQSCLRRISGIDLSVITFDPSSIWTNAYKQIRDKILSMTCDAVQAEVNKVKDELNNKLTLPYGLGSIRIDSGRPVREWDDVLRDEVLIDRRTIQREMNREIFGNDNGMNPSLQRFDTTTLDEKVEELKNTRQANGQEVESTQKQIKDLIESGKINLKSIFNKKDEDKQSSQKDEGN